MRLTDYDTTNQMSASVVSSTRITPEDSDTELRHIDLAVDSLDFTMPWNDDAKKMLELVPSPFRQVAAKNTEKYTREHDGETVTVELFDAFRKELGM